MLFPRGSAHDKQLFFRAGYRRIQPAPPLFAEHVRFVEHDDVIEFGTLRFVAGALAFAFSLRFRCGMVLLVQAAGYGLALRKAYRSLEGMNGDISGYALTLSELSALGALAIL